jgi:hypothetical protein
LEKNGHLIVEAGTGVGKSLAYLIPAIFHAVAHNKKAIISTHTINLQEQLILKDLPMLTKALPVQFQFTMLKGRHNYLCTRRLQKAILQGQQLFPSSGVEELKRIFAWSKKTQDGSLSDFETEPDPQVWQTVCSERGLCSPALCGRQSQFVNPAIPIAWFLVRMLTSVVLQLGTPAGTSPASRADGPPASRSSVLTFPCRWVTIQGRRSSPGFGSSKAPASNRCSEAISLNQSRTSVSPASRRCRGIDTSTGLPSYATAHAPAGIRSPGKSLV